MFRTDETIYYFILSYDSYNHGNDVYETELTKFVERMFVSISDLFTSWHSLNKIMNNDIIKLIYLIYNIKQNNCLQLNLRFCDSNHRKSQSFPIHFDTNSEMPLERKIGYE